MGATSLLSLILVAVISVQPLTATGDESSNYGNIRKQVQDAFRPQK
jgi:hypothetical protein